MLLMFVKENVNAMMGVVWTVKEFMILFEWGLLEKVMCSFERGEIYGFNFQSISQSLSLKVYSKLNLKRLKNKMKWN